MQIDRSAAHSSNVNSPSIETWQPGSNLTTERSLQQAKHPGEIDSTSVEMATSVSLPKYRISEIPPESVRKSPEIFKKGLPRSKVTLFRPEPDTDRPVICRSLAGKEIDLSNLQPLNAQSPRAENLESDWNVRFERDAHEAKQALDIVSTDEGMQMN
jgi:hypothetical protein